MQGIASQGEPGVWVREFQNAETVLPDILGTLMARAGFGLILTNVDRRIFFINDKAETFLRAGHGLRCERNCISAGDFATSKKLESLIREASRRSDQRLGAGSLLIRDEGGAAALAVHVMPIDLCHLEHQPTDEYPCAALVLVDCRPAPVERMQLFADLFALTAGEARVAAELIQGGGGLKKVAARLKISPATVRTHLTSIMDKTATHRQAELVKLFYEVTLPGSWGSGNMGRKPQHEKHGGRQSTTGRRDRAAMASIAGT
ncbi:MAG TPA: helix-turn-helix transcriptional regulator [Methylocella sp.]|nr:helix-turn-helix transcriptional regulator [Methylocella sp.]